MVVNTENKGCIIKCTNPFIEELFESPIFSEINNIPNGISFYWIHYMLEMHWENTRQCLVFSKWKGNTKGNIFWLPKLLYEAKYISMQDKLACENID